MIKLSIIVPVYNTEKYLNDCINSIIISDKNFELILVDDGSTDSSAKICEDLCKKDSRIKFFHKENGGVSSARNYGLEHSIGKYIMFVDSDDILSENWDLIFNYLNDDDIYYFDGRIKSEINKNELLEYICGSNEQHVYLAGPISKAYKFDFLKNNNLFFKEDLVNGEDMLFNVEVALLVSSFKVIKHNFYNYRQVVGQSTRKFNDKIINSDYNFHKYLSDIFNNYNVDEKLKIKIQNYCLMNAVVLIINRISYIDKYKNARTYFDFLKIDIYNNISMSEYFKKKNKIMFYLLKLKKYRIIYNFYRFKIKIAIFLRKLKKKEFYKI